VILLCRPPAKGLVQAGERSALLPMCRLHGAVFDVVEGLERIALEEGVDVLEAVSAVAAASLGQVLRHLHPVTQPVLPSIHQSSGSGRIRIYLVSWIRIRNWVVSGPYHLILNLNNKNLINISYRTQYIKNKPNLIQKIKTFDEF